MAYNNLISKVEQATKTYLSGKEIDPTPNFYTGKSDETKAAPAVICWAESGEEDIIGLGVYFVPLTVVVRSLASKGKEAHGELCAQIFDAISADDLAAQLSEAGFHCYAALESGFSSDQSGDALEDSMTRKLYCCAADVAP